MDEVPQTRAWLVEHFRQLVDDSQRLSTLVRLNVKGISALTQVPRVLEIFEETGRVSDYPETRRVAINAEAELAQREVNEGFPITLSQFLVDVWGMVEAHTRNLVMLWLKHENGMVSDVVSKLKIRIGEYEQHQGDARFYFVVKLLEREQASAIKTGVDRFESLLQCVGLDGPVPKKLRDAMFELSQLRNCVVHNARRVDARLVALCPWLSLTEGQLISPEYSRSFFLDEAARDYSMLVITRATALVGGPIENVAQRIRVAWE